MKKIALIPFLLLLMLVTSCFEDQDDTTIEITQDLEVKQFVYRALNFFYLFKEDIPQLANDAFANTLERDNFLQSFDTPEALFDFLNSDQDRFSVLFPDFEVIENALGGITLNNGMEFGLIRYPTNPSNVFGYVRYVIPNSSAATENVMRGMIFNRINGTQLTDTNFNNLLSTDTYTIGLANFDGENVTPFDQEITLVKGQLTENPIHLATTIEIDEINVGYLMYNGFTASFDEQLNDTFGQFAATGVTELVLDLRYNGGGSVRTATDLAAMITGQFNNQVLYNEIWNEDRQEQFATPGLFNDTTRNNTPINSLGLTRVYVLTTQSTASASELVINSLKPYIEVVQIGTNTTGKFQASILLYDGPAPNFSKSQASTNHKYVMLPLVFKTANINGVTDFIDGLVPTIEQNEDFSNLGQLGTLTEPLLATAINEILSGRTTIPYVAPLEFVSENKENPLYQVMIED